MDKSGFFSSLGAYLKANRKFFLVVVLILVSTFGYFWYRSGFTFDFSRFFAATQISFDVTPAQVAPGQTVHITWNATGHGANKCITVAGNFDTKLATVGFADETISPTTTAATVGFRVDCYDLAGDFVAYGQDEVTIVQGSTPACSSDSDCYDPEGCVRPVCRNPGTQNASCGTSTDACLLDVAPPAAPSCEKANIRTDVPSINVSGNPATSRVTNNNTGDCRITLVSYNIWSDRGGVAPHYIDQQTIFRSTTATVGPGQTTTLSVALPDCYSQVDVVIGDPLPQPRYSPGYFLGVEFWDVGDPDGTQHYCNEGFATPAPTPTPTLTTTPTPTPTPSATVTPTPLACSPTSQLVAVGAPATMTGSGGITPYGWYAPGSNPATGGGTSFIATYMIPGEKVVTMTGGGNQATCRVIVAAATPTPTPSLSATLTPTPTPTPTPTGSAAPIPTGSITPTTPLLIIQKMVRNITQGSGEGDSTNANPIDTVEFSLRVSSIGTGAVANVVVRDALPAGLSYISGSTAIDGAPASDGIISTGLNLGDMSPGRTITVRFRATVAAASFFASGTSVLTNTGYARGSNAPEVSDVAFVTIVNAPQNLTMSLVKMGRNITRGETGERTPVLSSPGQTIEFVLRVRNTSNAPLTNVVLRDIVPTGITAIAGSARIGSVTASDTLFGAGLSLGTLAVGQEIVVIFSGRVAVASELPAGTTTLINTVQASATGVGMLTAQLPVIITSTAVVVPPVDTGPGESTVLALIISGIITLLYVGYTGTDTYRRHEVGELVKDAKDEPFNFGR